MNKKKGNQVETEPNWHNRTIWTNDCYYVLNGMNSNCVDMIYMDPPFNKKKNFVAPIGSKAAGAEFKDMWSYDDVKRAALRQIENKHKAVYNVVLAAMNEDDRAFLLYMAPIVMHCERVLKRDTGSFWLHCDHTMASHLKLLCDAIFGRKNFRNDVVWYYTNRMPSGATRKFDDMYDNLLFYAGKNSVFNRQRTDEYTNMMKKAIEDGYWDSDKRKQGKKKVLRIIDKKNPKAKRMLKRQEEYDDVDKNYKPKRKVACSVWDDIGAPSRKEQGKGGRANAEAPETSRTDHPIQYQSERSGARSFLRFGNHVDRRRTPRQAVDGDRHRKERGGVSAWTSCQGHFLGSRRPQRSA